MLTTGSLVPEIQLSKHNQLVQLSLIRPNSVFVAKVTLCPSVVARKLIVPLKL